MRDKNGCSVSFGSNTGRPHPWHRRPASRHRAQLPRLRKIIGLAMRRLQFQLFGFAFKILEAYVQVSLALQYQVFDS